MNLSKVISSEFDNLKKRLVKVLRFGKDDVQTAQEAAPFGTDSNPIKDMIAVYMPTSERGKNVIVGYLNKNQLAEVGEHRIYSTDSGGELKAYVWLKNDGNIELLGTGDNLVKYSPLNQELQEFKTAIQAELVKIQAGLTGVGGAYAPGSLTVNISDAKIEKIKVPS